MKKKFLIFVAIALFSIFLGLRAFAASNFETYVTKGYMAYENHNYSAAIKNFKKALKIDEAYSVYGFLGMSYAMSGDIEKAEEMFNVAISKFPDEWSVYTLIGDIKKAQHLTPVAINYYEKAMNTPKISDKNKAYCKKLIEEAIQEQKEYENINETSVDNNIKPDITIDLDTKEWNLAYLQGDETNWIMEYGLKNEDVINYEWTKLYTINFFAKSKYNFTSAEYYNSFVKLLKKQADDAVKLNKISENENEIYFEWNVINRNECEIDRIFTTDKGLYFVHFAKKTNKFSEAEKTQIINILKSVKTK